MKMSEFILILQKIKNKYGDKEVYLSADDEGNAFYTLMDNLANSIEFKGNGLIIYPYKLIDVDDIK